MRGDFSAWNKDGSQNFRGTLHQQGRVLLDRDWNAQTEIFSEWQETAGRDAFGAGIAAVPAEVPQSFRVTEAKIDAGVVKISVSKGRVWADGLLVESAQDITNRVAIYLNLPPASVPNHANTPRDTDTVILETWLEELSPFQLPSLLIEPALGGVDTTERVQTAYRFRLYRMEDGETCDSIIPKLKDDFSIKGKLTVKLNPNVTIDGDCPVVESGGYTGFEHRLYRIEIAETCKEGSWFKWSQFNGGLVGTGDFDVSNRKVAIHGNMNAIIHSGLNEFYLEALDLDPKLGCWRVVYGAKATLAADNTLALPAAASDIFNGVIPSAPAKGKRFFRLWNGIERVNDYTAKKDLPDHLGIRLQFDAEAVGNYTPSDFWTFEVRAGEIGNPLVLIPNLPPQGIFYHRVPLAEVTWTDSSVADSYIEDCRRVFQPLTKLKTCCTYRVGDGIHSFGDFDSIQAAIDALPTVGGQVCVLPGEYTENIQITNRANITLVGCGLRSRVTGGAPTEEFGEAAPVIHVRGGQNITIADLAVVAHDSGVGLMCEGADPNFGQDQTVTNPLVGVTLRELHVSAAAHSAIRIVNASDVTLRECHVSMHDTACLDPAVFALGDDLLIERNVVEVPFSRVEAPSAVGLVPPKAADFLPGSLSRGGIQIGGTSDRVRIIDNLIRGGSGNGITLGSLIFIDDGKEPVPPRRWPRPRPVDPCDPKQPANSVIVIVAFPTDGGQVRQASAGTLTEIVIERNRIYQTGMNGIGVAGFFDLSEADEFITVEGLAILGNDIRGCLRRPLEPIAEAMVNSQGYGGIALADVERLVIRDNVIIDNGPSHLEPVCGIFVLHAEGLEISRNRILNNGAKTEASNAQAKIGRRGGINIVYAVAPVSPVRIGKLVLPGQSGDPALKVHDNVVSALLGQALNVTALGPLSVEGNQFTSRGVVQRGPGATFIAATVAILNLGLSTEFYLQFLAFSAIAKGSLAVNNLAAASTARPGLDDQRLGAYLAGGNVLFADNQCMLDVIETGITLSVSSVAILSLDDIGFVDNQCDCSLLDDIVLSHVVLFGFSLRACNNRFKESLLHARFSALTLGLVNTTTHNQATHCILARAFIPAYRVATPNTVLIDPLGTGFCEGTSRILPGFGKTIGVTSNG